MGKVLVVSHSANPRDLVLWHEVVAMDPNVDLVLPILNKDFIGSPSQNAEYASSQIFELPAREPFGPGHSTMWINGIIRIAEAGQYDFIHVAFEPWALIPQVLCSRFPTVVHGAESVLKDAPLPLKVRRVGTKRVLQKAVGVLSWGQTSLDEFRRAGLPSTTPQGVIPVGVPDPNLFRAKPIDQNPGPFRVLFVGRLVKEKGIETLIQALCAMNRLVTLKVIGEGPLLVSLDTLLSVCPKIELIVEGKATAGEVAEAMAWAHIIVVPSQSTRSWNEQWGRVAIEAMLSGRPTVVSDNGELPNLVNYSDLVFPEGDSVALAKVIRGLEENREILPEIGQRMVQRASQFAPQVLSAQLAEFWERTREHLRSQ